MECRSSAACMAAERGLPRITEHVSSPRDAVDTCSALTLSAADALTTRARITITVPTAAAYIAATTTGAGPTTATIRLTTIAPLTTDGLTIRGRLRSLTAGDGAGRRGMATTAPIIRPTPGTPP